MNLRYKYSLHPTGLMMEYYRNRLEISSSFCVRGLIKEQFDTTDRDELEMVSCLDTKFNLPIDVLLAKTIIIIVVNRTIATIRNRKQWNDREGETKLLAISFNLIATFTTIRDLVDRVSKRKIHYKIYRLTYNSKLLIYTILFDIVTLYSCDSSDRLYTFILLLRHRLTTIASYCFDVVVITIHNNRDHLLWVAVCCN